MHTHLDKTNTSGPNSKESNVINRPLSKEPQYASIKYNSGARINWATVSGKTQYDTDKYRYRYK